MGKMAPPGPSMRPPTLLYRSILLSRRPDGQHGRRFCLRAQQDFPVGLVKRARFGTDSAPAVGRCHGIVNKLSHKDGCLAATSRQAFTLLGSRHMRGPTFAFVGIAAAAFA